MCGGHQRGSRAKARLGPTGRVRRCVELLEALGLRLPATRTRAEHERVIRLAAWQTWLVEKYTAEFLAGLIQSDGCRVTNRVKGRAYPRYFFSNLSPDVRGLFRMACEIAGIECRPNRPNCLSVARRGSVELLDRLIGPKN